jgi:hypothetical protein
LGPPPAFGGFRLGLLLGFGLSFLRGFAGSCASNKDEKQMAAIENTIGSIRDLFKILNMPAGLQKIESVFD